jgi:hypothetical protein
MYRISFDTNFGSAEFGYPLSFRQSLKEIEQIGEELREGLCVIIYMDGELEMDAILRFDKELGHWLGVPIPNTIRYIG